MAWRNQSSRCVHQSYNTHPYFKKKTKAQLKCLREWCALSNFILISTTVVGGFYNRQTKLCDTQGYTKALEAAEPSFKILSNWLSKGCLCLRQHTGRPGLCFMHDQDHWIRCSVSSFPSKAAKRFLRFTFHSHCYLMQMLQTKKSRILATFWSLASKNNTQYWHQN